MSSPLTPTSIKVLRKEFNAGTLSAVFYSTSPDSGIYAIDIDKEMLQEFEYANEDCAYTYDEDWGHKRPCTTFTTPDDLSDSEMNTLILSYIAMYSDEDALYTRKEWEAKHPHQHNVGLEKMTTVVAYPMSIKVVIESKKDIWRDTIEAELQKLTVWATYDKKALPCLQVKRILAGEIDIYSILTQTLACFKEAETLFDSIEKKVLYEYENPL